MSIIAHDLGRVAYKGEASYFGLVAFSDMAYKAKHKI